MRTASGGHDILRQIAFEGKSVAEDLQDRHGADDQGGPSGTRGSLARPYRAGALSAGSPGPAGSDPAEPYGTVEFTLPDAAVPGGALRTHPDALSHGNVGWPAGPDPAALAGPPGKSGASRPWATEPGPGHSPAMPAAPAGVPGHRLAADAQPGRGPFEPPAPQPGQREAGPANVPFPPRPVRRDPITVASGLHPAPEPYHDIGQQHASAHEPVGQPGQIPHGEQGQAPGPVAAVPWRASGPVQVTGQLRVPEQRRAIGQGQAPGQSGDHADGHDTGPGPVPHPGQLAAEQDVGFEPSTGPEAAHPAARGPFEPPTLSGPRGNEAAPARPRSAGADAVPPPPYRLDSYRRQSYEPPVMRESGLGFPGYGGHDQPGQAEAGGYDPVSSGEAPPPEQAGQPDRVPARAAWLTPAGRSLVVAPGSELAAPSALLAGDVSANAPGGWRRAILHVTAGVVRVPASAAERRRRVLYGRVRAPVISGHHRVVVLSLKGGVGKTTLTVGLGATLASLRGDPVIAVDASPGRGTLSDKVAIQTPATVRDLIAARDRIGGYPDVRAFTSRSASGLEILASDQDPAASAEFGAGDYATVGQILQHYYRICLTDCGTGLVHSAMGAILQMADQIVLASTSAVDSARSASATLDWLIAHGYGDLVSEAIVVFSGVRPRSKNTVGLDLLDEHFSARCRVVATIPYDVKLEEGAEIELDQLSGKTREAFLELAALVADRFTVPRRAGSGYAPWDAGWGYPQAGWEPSEGGWAPPEGGWEPREAGWVPPEAGWVPREGGEAPPETGWMPYLGDAASSEAGWGQQEGWAVPEPGHQVPAETGWAAQGADWAAPGGDWAGPGANWAGPDADWAAQGGDWAAQGADWSAQGGDWSGPGGDWAAQQTGWDQAGPAGAPQEAGWSSPGTGWVPQEAGCDSHGTGWVPPEAGQMPHHAEYVGVGPGWVEGSGGWDPQNAGWAQGGGWDPRDGGGDPRDGGWDPPNPGSDPPAGGWVAEGAWAPAGEGWMPGDDGRAPGEAG